MVITSALHAEGRRFEPGRKQITFAIDETFAIEHKILSHVRSEKKKLFKEYLCYLRYTAVSRNFVLQILSVKAYRGPIPKGALGSVCLPLVSERQRKIH